MVKWITESYTVQKNIVIKGGDLPHTSFAGEILCDTVYWKPVPNATDWYTPMTKKDGFVMIRLK